jgi:Dolichyl-phosphate-mannose-protein mannosyltransferase
MSLVRQTEPRQTRPRAAPWRGIAIATALFLVFTGYGRFLLRNTAFSVGGSDSSGYINAARRLAAGRLVERPRSLERLALPDDVVQIFIPLGFMTGPNPGTMAPFYPVGFPAHMVAAAALMGWDRGPYLVSPLAALLCLPLVYLLGRELRLPPLWSAGAAATLAVWPVFLFQAIQPMSDVVATLWTLAAVLFSLRARRRPGWSAAAGAAFGIAILVRPTNVLLALPLLFALPLTPVALAVFTAAATPFAAMFAAYNARCYGSWFQTGYGKIGLLTAFTFANFPLRSRYYVLWLVKTFTPLLPAAWLGLAADRKAPLRVRVLLLSWFGVFFVAHCLYGPYESFGFVRFLLPGSPALAVGAAIAARDLLQAVTRPRTTLRVGALLLAVVLGVEVRSARSIGVSHFADGESVYPQACLWASRQLPKKSVVLAMQVSGSLEHYTDLTYARWDWISPERFGTLRREAERKGYRWFALLFPGEVEEFSKHTPGHWRRIGEMREVTLLAIDP